MGLPAGYPSKSQVDKIEKKNKEIRKKSDTDSEYVYNIVDEITNDVNDFIDEYFNESIQIDEMGSNDIHFKNIIGKYRSTKFIKRINMYLFGKPTKGNANDVAKALRNMDYKEITQMEKELNLQESLTEGLILEGGAAGHLAHPFEDGDLTFNDMKEMIKRGLVGGLDKEAPVTEKLDGQNIAFSFKDGKIIFGRNKGHVRDAGKNALDVKGITQQFTGRGGIEKAFVGAAEDLQSAISKLTPEQTKNMFKNGSKFMSLEIILPDTQNVIPYGKSVLVMHGTIEYNKEGEQINRSSTDGEEFAQAVQKVGADKQKTFGIEGPKVIAFSDAESLKYAKLAKEYTSNLNDVAKEFGLNSKSKLEDYRNKWWQKKIDSENKELNLKLSPKEKQGLVNRWANGDKTFGVKSFSDNTKSDWFRNFETNELQKSQKEMIKPIENTFLNAGAQTLKRVSNFLSTNSPTAAKELKRDTLIAIKSIRDSKDPDKIAKLQKELERLDSIGLDNLVPSEGVVFMYNGNPYKYTGTFAPINQIQGTFKFDKPAKKEDKSTENEIAIFTGRFQPFHAGHYSIYKSLVDKFGKDNVYISSSNIMDPVKSPFPFKDKKMVMNKMFDIPNNKIIQVKNPYSPSEILSKYPEDTKYVTAVSQKDAERLEKGGSYFKNYDKVPSNKKKGYEDEGYYIVAPEMQLKVNGKNISGTQLRATFGNDLLTTKEKKDIFNQVYPKFDKDIFANIVVTTKKAEAAKKSTDTKKPKDLKSKIKSLDPKTKKRVEKVLQTKIKNPDTGNTILVKSALKYDDTMRVKKQAVSLVKQAMKG